MNTNDQQTAEGQLAAYALGALDPEDSQRVEALLADSPAHREELRRLREVVALLPYAAPAAEPPARLRERLLARVEASRAGQPAHPAPGQPGHVTTPGQARPARRPTARWLVPGLVTALAVLLLALGSLTLSLGATVARLERANSALGATVASLDQSLGVTRAHQERLAAQLAESQRQIGQAEARIAAGELQLAQMSARAAQDEYVIAFVSAPGVATRQLAPADAVALARGEMYMYPGKAGAVVLFSGLPPLQPGQVYQLWLADSASQIAGGTFQVDAMGLAHLVVEAPREVNAFSEVMVTIEPSGGSPTPSSQVVLAGSL